MPCQNSIFRIIIDEINDPKGLENIICIMMMNGETFYGRHTS